MRVASRRSASTHHRGLAIADEGGASRVLSEEVGQGVVEGQQLAVEVGRVAVPHEGGEGERDHARPLAGVAIARRIQLAAFAVISRVKAIFSR